MNTSGDLAPHAALQSWWMPFTHNRYFKAHPHLIAERAGAYYTLTDGRRVFDCLSGLWCTPLGHAHPEIVQAVQRRCSAGFQPGVSDGTSAGLRAGRAHRALAGRPERPRVLHQLRFRGGRHGAEDRDCVSPDARRGARTRIIGRERGYHGVGLGGISVGGIGANRKMFAPLMVPGVDHLPHTYEPDRTCASAADSRNGARIWPTSSNDWLRCTMRRRSPR